jgi:hypothetical protein
LLWWLSRLAERAAGWARCWWWGQRCVERRHDSLVGPSGWRAGGWSAARSRSRLFPDPDLDLCPGHVHVHGNAAMAARVRVPIAAVEAVRCPESD